jgi:hypothetical protein
MITYFFCFPANFARLYYQLRCHARDLIIIIIIIIIITSIGLESVTPGVTKTNDACKIHNCFDLIFY